MLKGGRPLKVPKQSKATKQNVTSDLQKSRHLQKSRVTERHNRGTKRKLKSHQAQKKALRAFFGAGGATSVFALCPDCAAP